MTTTPHRVGQVAKAELLIADRLDAWGLTDPNQRAAWLIQQLQTELGWTPPRDLTETPPPRPDRPADHDGPGRQAFREARAALAARTRTANPPTPTTEGDPQ